MKKIYLRFYENNNVTDETQTLLNEYQTKLQQALDVGDYRPIINLILFGNPKIELPINYKLITNWEG